MKTVMDMYNFLLSQYGPQGWWPIYDFEGNNTSKNGSKKGYHPNRYDFPRSETECWEICMGAILTQNTTWLQAERAVHALLEADIGSPSKLLNTSNDTIHNLIKPSGFFKQKCESLKNLATYFEQWGFGSPPLREDLLTINGVGPETCDCILLYAFSYPVFVVDTYTKRLLKSVGFDLTDNYSTIQKFISGNIPLDVRMYQEFHALIVEQNKRWPLKKSQKTLDLESENILTSPLHKWWYKD